MRFTSLILLPLLLLLLVSSSCLADSQQQQYQHSVQSEQSHSGAGAAGENSEKSVANAEDKSQNKRGAPIVVGTPAQHTAYINHHVVAAPISGHTTHAAIGAVPFGYGHTVTSGGHILQTPTAAAVATGVPQHVLHKVSYVGPATATTTTTTLKLASVSDGLHQLSSFPSSGAGSALLAKYNYAVPQVTYTHYPTQYQLVHHHQTGPGGVQPATIYAAHALHEHPVGEIATHHQSPQQQHQQQQQTAYAHQQPIYAHHPAAIHYSLALPGQHNYAGQLQQQQHQQQQQQQHPLSHTQAIHYQQQAVAANLGGQQPAVPIVHQAPIAAINQVHQAQQVYATQGQLSKYPLAANSLYGTGGLQNQIYSTVPSYVYHQNVGTASNGLVGKQLLPTAATPVHLKSMVPLTTATTTQHHGNGISYTAFTQPSHAAAHLKPLPQSGLQTQPSYYSAAASSAQQQQQHSQQQYQQQAQAYYRNQLQQQLQQQQQQQPSQQQQQQRIQIYSTVASPLQKAPILYGAGQFSHPVPSQYAAYPYGNQPQPQQQQQQQQQQQSALYQAASQQSQASLGKITYASPVGVHNAGGTGAFGGRGSIYLLH